MEFTGAFPAPGWSPPAREPFVPLRPLTLGQVLAGAFRTLRHNPAVTLIPAIVLSVVATLLGIAFGHFVVGPAIVELGGADAVGPEFFGWFSGFGAGLIGWAFGHTLGIAAGVAQQAVSATDVRHAIVGRRLTPAGLRRRTRGIRGAVGIWTLVVVVALLVAAGAGIALLGVVATASALAASFTAMAVIPAAAVLLAWAGTRLAFVPSAIAIERTNVRGGVRRSWQLTRGRFWPVLGIRLLLWSMIWLATLLVSVPVSLLVDLLVGIVAGNGDYGDYLTLLSIGGFVAGVVVSAIGAIGLVVTTAGDALLYVDARMRREGLDLELGRFMETRRATTRFDPAEPDPFRSPGIPRFATPPAAPGGTTWG